VGARALERRPWGAYQHTFCSYLKTRFKQKFRPRTHVGFRRLEDPLPDPCVVTPAYYYNFVKFISSAKCGLLLRKRTNFASSKFWLLYFTSNSVVFVDRGRKNISCPRAQDSLVTLLLLYSLALAK